MNIFSKSKKRWIISGHYGFLGSHFFQIFRSLEENIKVLDFDLKNYLNFKNILKPEDIVVHCAYTNNLIDQNIIDFNIIRACRNSQCTLVTIGSDAAYDPKLLDHSEQNYLIGDTLEDWKELGIQKRNLYNSLKQYSKEDELRSFHFVGTSFFGPGFKIGDNHLIHAIIQSFLKKDYKVLDCNLYRNCIYVDDFVLNSINLIKLKNKNDCYLYNLGTIHSSISEIACEVSRQLYFDTDKLKFLKTELNQHKFLNSDKAKKELGNKYKFTTLINGIHSTLTYAKEIL